MIKKAAQLFIAFIFITPSLLAQEDIKRWEEGLLQWEDFRAEPPDTGTFEYNYYIGYHSVKKKFHDTTLIRYEADAYFYKDLSWVDHGSKTELNLRYNRLIFNIIELQRRALQVKLDLIASAWEMEAQLERTIKASASEIAQLRNESQEGRIEWVVAMWEKRLAKELASTLQQAVPGIERRNFGYALHVNAGIGTFTGSLGRHTKPSFNLMFGFDWAFKDVILYMNGTLAWGQMKQTYTDREIWEKGKNTHFALFDFSMGYAVLDGARIKLSPFAGIGISEFSLADPVNDDDPVYMYDNNFLFGVNADCKLRKRIKLTPSPMMGAKEYVETSLRARLYITKTHYRSDLNGYSINLTLGICGFGNLLRVKQK